MPTVSRSVPSILAGFSASRVRASLENAGTPTTHGDRTKVNFTVRLPENLRFAGQSVNGDVKAQDMGRFVRASTVNGSVRVSTKAWAELSSVNGSIDASMSRAQSSSTTFPYAMGY